MIIHVYLLLIVFTFILMLIGLSWESYAYFIVAMLLSFSVASLSLMIQIPYSSSIVVFSDSASRVLFILIGILNLILGIVYKLQSTVEEQSEYDRY